MTIDTLIMLAGAFVAVLPFLGFPSSWNTVFFVIVGIFVIALGIVVRRRDNPMFAPRQKEEATLPASDRHEEEAGME